MLTVPNAECADFRDCQQCRLPTAFTSESAETGDRYGRPTLLTLPTTYIADTVESANTANIPDADNTNCVDSADCQHYRV